jgi:hypothetical protein
LRSASDRSSEKVDLRYVNARDGGASAAIPFFGGLTGTDRT